MHAASLALPIIGTFAIAGGLWAIARLLKRAGPSQSSDWSESPWGDVPNVSVHSSSIVPEAQRDHV